MPLNSQKLQSDIENILRNGLKDAFLATMNVGLIEDSEGIKNQTSKAFGDTAAKMATSITNAIETYIKSAQITGDVQVDPNTGKGAILPNSKID